MQTRRLPLFPLQLVLFPEESRALHIFEPRYRQLLSDCRAGDARFGIVPVFPGDRPVPDVETVGCLARIVRVAPHPDGRADIVVVGERRFRIVGYPQNDRPYLVALTSPFDDVPDEPSPLEVVSAEVRDLFVTYIEAAAGLTEQRPSTMIPEDPMELSFAAAATISVDLRTKVQLLNLRSTVERLRMLLHLLELGIEAARAQAKVQARAKRNGKRPALKHRSSDL